MNRYIASVIKVLFAACCLVAIYTCLAMNVKDNKVNPEGDKTTLREIIGTNITYVDVSMCTNDVGYCFFDAGLTGLRWTTTFTFDFREQPLYSIAIPYRKKPECSKIFPLAVQCDFFEAEDGYVVRVNYITHTDGEGFHGFYLLDQPWPAMIGRE